MKPDEKAAREYAHNKQWNSEAFNTATEKAHLSGQQFQIDTLAEMAGDVEEYLKKVTFHSSTTDEEMRCAKTGIREGFTLGRASMQGEIDAIKDDGKSDATVIIDAHKMIRSLQDQLTQRDAEILRLNEMVEVMEKGFKKLRDTIELGPYFGTEITKAVMDADEILNRLSELRKKL